MYVRRPGKTSTVWCYPESKQTKRALFNKLHPMFSLCAPKGFEAPSSYFTLKHLFQWTPSCSQKQLTWNPQLPFYSQWLNSHSTCFFFCPPPRSWTVSVDVQNPRVSVWVFRDEWHVKVSRGGEQPLQWAGLMCSQQTAAVPSSARLNWARGFVRRGAQVRSALTFPSLRRTRGPPPRGHSGSFKRARARVTRCCRAKPSLGEAQQLCAQGGLLPQGGNVCFRQTRCASRHWTRTHVACTHVSAVGVRCVQTG